MFDCCCFFAVAEFLKAFFVWYINTVFNELLICLVFQISHHVGGIKSRFISCRNWTLRIAYNLLDSKFCTFSRRKSIAFSQMHFQCITQNLRNEHLLSLVFRITLSEFNCHCFFLYLLFSIPTNFWKLRLHPDCVKLKIPAVSKLVRLKDLFKPFIPFVIQHWAFESARWNSIFCLKCSFRQIWRNASYIWYMFSVWRKCKVRVLYSKVVVCIYFPAIFTL